MNTIPKIVNFDTCTTQKEITFVDRPKTEPLISNAFIESAREIGVDVDIHVVRQRVIDLLSANKNKSYTRLEIYNKVHSRASSGESWKSVSKIVDSLLEGDIITAEHGEYATKYTLSQIRESAIEEIKSRGQITEEYKVWIPRRWR